MKKLNESSLMLMLVLFCASSCTNEYELLESNNKVTWETELNNIISDFEFLFNNSSVSFIKAEKINNGINEMDFFNEETLFPVCFNKLYNFFMLKDYDFVFNDTNTIHTSGVVMKSIVSNIVEKQEQYDFVSLSWSFCDYLFKTIAVFDKKNGQIVYDNILTNLPLSNISLPFKKSKMTRAETGGGGNVETKIFYKTIENYYNNLDEYSIYIKALCTVTFNHDNNNQMVAIRTYKSVHFNYIEPSNPYELLYSQGEAAKLDDNLIAYIWVGSTPCPFNSTYANNCNSAASSYANGYAGGYGRVWCQPVSSIIDIATLEENPSSGEWAFM